MGILTVDEAVLHFKEWQLNQKKRSESFRFQQVQPYSSVSEIQLSLWVHITSCSVGVHCFPGWSRKAANTVPRLAEFSPGVEGLFPCSSKQVAVLQSCLICSSIVRFWRSAH